MSKFARDLIERVLWTGAEAAVAVLIVVNTDTPSAYTVLIAAGLALVKGAIAKHINKEDSASTAPGV